ncbi:MAG: adenylate kinase [Ruminococcaceae bacterium]|nr:adenylate kinase [Oscillospiraceae bacterium]
MKLILLGAPGAGKGTQSANISAKYNIPAIATGDILRTAIKEGTELGKSAKSYIDAGKLVPDEVVIGIINEKLASESCRNGFILDGFPRSIPQAEALDAMGVKMDVVLNIEVPDEKIIERMSGRRVCSCGASYHVAYLPPKKDGVCDKCGAELYVRADDAEATVRNRLETYHAQTEPLKEYYAAKGILVTVNGRDEVADTTADVLAALDKVEC